MTWSNLWYDVIHTISHAVYTLSWSLKCEGTKNMPRSGPVLVVANHQSFLDPIAVGNAVGRRLTFLARKSLFRKSLFAKIISSLNAVPIDQEGVGKDGIRAVVEQLKIGRAVLVFPEGSRTPDGRMHPLMAGIHLIIKRAPAQIVPVGIAGMYDALPIWRRYPHFSPLFWPAGPAAMAACVGKPLDSGRLADLPREEALRILYDEIHHLQERAEKIRRK